MKTVVILSVSSDIGAFLAEQYLTLGFRVVGTYRTTGGIEALLKDPRCILVKCDVHQRDETDAFIKELKHRQVTWDSFISCVGYPPPLTGFFNTDFDTWQASFEVNALDQLRVLHALYPLRSKGSLADVVFFAGGGTNNAVVNFSAYTLAKLTLTKMCEFLDAENADLNVFIVGPGWTKTKIHRLIPNSDAKKPGTPLRDIFECIQWLSAQGRSVAGGRNFSIVYDPWRPSQRELLVKELKADPDMYKLRRHKNNFLRDREQ